MLSSRSFIKHLAHDSFWVNICEGSRVCVKINFFKISIYLFLQRRERWEKEREKNINVWKKHQLVASHMPPFGDLTHNPGLCSDWELNQWPLGLQAGTQSTEPHQPGQDKFSFACGCSVVPALFVEKIVFTPCIASILCQRSVDCI